MDAVNASLFRTFKMRFDMGLFDPPASQPYWNVPTSEINTQAAQDLNLLATLSGLVLLQVRSRPVHIQRLLGFHRASCMCLTAAEQGRPAPSCYGQEDCRHRPPRAGLLS